MTGKWFRRWTGSFALDVTCARSCGRGAAGHRRREGTGEDTGAEDRGPRSRIMRREHPPLRVTESSGEHATAEALAAGRKIDGHAEGTDRYRTLEGALACLIEDCGVEGLSASHDERDLFDDA